MWLRVCLCGILQTIQVSLGIWCDSSSGKGLKSTSVSSSPTRSMSSLAMGNPLPSRITGSDPLPMRVTDKSKSLRKETDGDKERKAGGGDTCRLQQQEGGCDEEPLEQTDFDFRLSMLPEWAQKAALSRPSVALSSAGKTSNQQKDNQPQARGAEGRWEEVSGSVVLVGRSQKVVNLYQLLMIRVKHASIS